MGVPMVPLGEHGRVPGPARLGGAGTPGAERAGLAHSPSNVLEERPTLDRIDPSVSTRAGARELHRACCLNVTGAGRDAVQAVALRTIAADFWADVRFCLGLHARYCTGMHPEHLSESPNRAYTPYGYRGSAKHPIPRPLDFRLFFAYSATQGSAPQTRSAWCSH